MQHLPEVEGSNPHRKALGTFEGTEHTITLEPGSLTSEAAGELVHLARCHHHQAVVDERRHCDGLACLWPYHVPRPRELPVPGIQREQISVCRATDDVPVCQRRSAVQRPNLVVSRPPRVPPPGTACRRIERHRLAHGRHVHHAPVHEGTGLKDFRGPDLEHAGDAKPSDVRGSQLGKLRVARPGVVTGVVGPVGGGGTRKLHRGWSCAAGRPVALARDEFAGRQHSRCHHSAEPIETNLAEHRVGAVETPGPGRPAVAVEQVSEHGGVVIGGERAHCQLGHGDAYQVVQIRGAPLGRLPFLQEGRAGERWRGHSLELRAVAVAA